MKKVLVIDGGGSRGVIVTAFLKALEILLGKPIYEIFDLIVGTSVGGIIGGILSTGEISAQELHDIMYKEVDQIFKPSFYLPFLIPKYNNKCFDDIFSKYLRKDFLLKYCKTKFMCTSVNKVDGKTHYLKNWEEKDGKISILDAIKRTSAAPYYFKHIKEEKKNVWLDGGCGNANCPLLESFIDIVRLGYIKEEVSILSVGTGYISNKKSFKEAIKNGVIGDFLSYSDPLNGGLARNQSTRVSIEMIKTLCGCFPNITFQRINEKIDKKIYGMDKTKYKKEYEEIGKNWINKIDINLLKGE